MKIGDTVRKMTKQELAAYLFSFGAFEARLQHAQDYGATYLPTEAHELAIGALEQQQSTLIDEIAHRLGITE